MLRWQLFYSRLGCLLRENATSMRVQSTHKALDYLGHGIEKQVSGLIPPACCSVEIHSMDPRKSYLDRLLHFGRIFQELVHPQAPSQPPLRCTLAAVQGDLGDTGSQPEWTGIFFNQ